MFNILFVTVITKHYFKLHQYETFATSLNRSKSMEEGLNIARIAKSCTENINGCQGVKLILLKGVTITTVTTATVITVTITTVTI